MTPVSPLINVDTDGQWSSEPVQIRIPVIIPSGKLPVVYLFSPATGELEPLPIIDVSDSYVTIMGRNFEGSSSVTGNLRSADLPTGFQTGFAVFVSGGDLVPDYDTYFTPMADSWKNVNDGSICAPNGFCYGWVLSAIMCYSRHQSPLISSEYYECKSHGDDFDTPYVYQDNRNAIRLHSIIQAFSTIEGEYSKYADNVSPSSTYFELKRALCDTKQPQFLAINSVQKTGHALLVTSSKGNQLNYVDPNAPSVIGSISFSGGNFTPIVTSICNGEKQIEFNRFYFIPQNKMMNKYQYDWYWKQFLSRTIGKGVFEDILIIDQPSFPASGPANQLAQNYVTTQNNLFLAVMQNDSIESSATIDVFPSSTSSSHIRIVPLQIMGRTASPISLNPGKNHLGFEINLLPNGETASSTKTKWADFQWFDVVCLASPTSLNAVPGDKSITLSWDPVAGAASYTLYWANSPGVSTLTATAIKDVTSPYTHPGLSNYNTYYYIVTAECGGITSSYSSEIAAMPGFPSWPIASGPGSVAQVFQPDSVIESGEVHSGGFLVTFPWFDNVDYDGFPLNCKVPLATVLASYPGDILYRAWFDNAAGYCAYDSTKVNQTTPVVLHCETFASGKGFCAPVGQHVLHIQASPFNVQNKTSLYASVTLDLPFNVTAASSPVIYTRNGSDPFEILAFTGAHLPSSSGVSPNMGIPSGWDVLYPDCNGSYTC